MELDDKILEIAKVNNVHLITSNVRYSNKSSIKSLLNSGFNVNYNANLKYPDGEKKLSLYIKL